MGSRRGLVLAAVGVLGLAVLVLFLLVLPKMGEVSDAKEELDQARSEQVTLESEKSALEDAASRAPEARAQIADVCNKIPPTADEPGIIRLLNNAAIAAGIDVVSLAPSDPAFDETTGLSTIAVAVNATGTYFEVAQFMYQIETLPRAAKATSLTLTPGEAGATGTPTLSAALNVDLYTSDTSAGPGSVPGETTAAATTTGASSCP